MKKYLIIIACFISLFLCLPSSIIQIYANQSNEEYISEAMEYDPSKEGEIYTLNPNSRSFDANIIHYDLETQEMEYMYLNNSFNSIEQTIDIYTNYTNGLTDEGDPPCSNGINTFIPKNTNIDNRIGKTSTGGTAFLMGPNIALTAGHCVMNYKTKVFNSTLTIKFGYDDNDKYVNNGYSMYKEVSVTDSYILKLYYDDTTKFANDWAVCILDEYIGNELGYFGKCTGFDLTQYEGTIIGYPVGQNTHGQYILSAPILKNSPTIKYYMYGIEGFSGSPLFIEHNGNIYVAGVHSYKYDPGVFCHSGATRITSFLFDFLNYFLEENNRGVELRDYYYEGLTKIRYNTMSELIVKSKDEKFVCLSENGSSYQMIAGLKKYFYTSTTTSCYVDYNYHYFKNYIMSTGTYSNVYSFDTYFTEQARTAKYMIVNRTVDNDVIDTTFDQEDNIWYHNGTSGKVIKGTIAYNGYARNIEVTIPANGTNLSTMVTINDTSFQLRTGPYRVSIIASQRLVCNGNIIFAFGVA